MHGYTVLHAAHPREALAIVEGHAGSIDLLLTDVVMPEMSGPELAQRLQAVRPALKVLYMSGYTDDLVGPHGVLLEKPFTTDSLAVKVREVLGGRGA